MDLTGKLIAIVGPTASGKTAVAVEVAAALNGEIISADSMQIWRDLDIGTAKPTAGERSRVPFHLVDIADISQEFSVAQFQELARAARDDILSRGKTVVLAGGTGLYVRALVDEVEFPPPAPSKVRARLRREAEESGSSAMHARLALSDPEAAARISPADIKRIIRALEVLETTGCTLSSFIRRGSTGAAESSWMMFGLQWPPEQLEQRINARIDLMLTEGLVDEVRSLQRGGFGPHLQAGKALGYADVCQHIVGSTSYGEMVERIRINTRRYAKRQRTWFRADKRLRWMDAGSATATELADQVVAAVGNIKA